MIDHKIDESVCLNLFTHLQGVFFKSLPDSNRTLIYASAGCNQLTGYTEPELINNQLNCFSSIIHPEDVSKVLSALNASSNLTCNTEYRIITKRGEIKWIREISNRIIDQQGYIKYIEGFLQDITIEKDVTLLTNAFKSYQAAVNNSDLVDITDTDGKIIFVNEHFCEITGYAKSELIGQSHKIVNSKFHGASFFSDLWTTIKNGQIWRGEIRNKDKNGRYYWIDLTISPVLNADNQIYQFLSIGKVITEKKEAQLKLHDTFNSASAVIFQLKREVNNTYHFTYIGNNALSILKLPAEKLYKTENVFKQLIFETDLVSFMNSLEQSVNNKGEWFHMFRIGKLNNIKWLSAKASPKFLEDGSIIWEGTFSDITHFKSLESDVEVLNKQLAHIYDIQHECFWGSDVINSKMLYVSPGSHVIFGYAPEEFYKNSKLWFELVYDEDKPKFTNTYTLLNQGKMAHIEFRSKYPDGTIKWLECRMTGTLNEQGQLVRLDGITSNIDERKAIESALQRQEQMLKEAQRMAQIGSWELQLNNKQLIWSEEIYRIYELEPSNINNLYEIAIGKSHPEDTQMVMDTYHHSLETRESFRITHRLLFPDGRIKYIEQQCETLFDVHGKPYKSIGTTQDITVQKEISNQMEKLIFELTNKNKELKKKNGELDRIVQSMSNDLRAPLLSIQGLLDLLNDSIAPNEGISEIIQFLRNSAKRCEDSIKGIIEYSKNINKEVVYERIDMQLLIKNAIEHVRFQEQAFNIKFTKQCDNTPFFSDPTRIDAIISHLLTNAVKYQRRNEPDKFVHVQFEANSSNGILTITDNGEGIAEDRMVAIFEMFVRNSIQSVGSGLGLYLCKEMSEKLNGEITVKSEVGKGSTFTVTIPNHLIQDVK